MFRKDNDPLTTNVYNFLRDIEQRDVFFNETVKPKIIAAAVEETDLLLSFDELTALWIFIYANCHVSSWELIEKIIPEPSKEMEAQIQKQEVLNLPAAQVDELRQAINNGIKYVDNNLLLLPDEVVPHSLKLLQKFASEEQSSFSSEQVQKAMAVVLLKIAEEMDLQKQK